MPERENPPGRVSWMMPTPSLSHAQSLTGLRGWASMRDFEARGDDDDSPRVRHVVSADLKPPQDSRRRSTTRSSYVSASARTWYRCCGSQLVFPFATVILTLAFTCGLAVYLWTHRKPKVAEGAFGKLAQNTRPESVQEANFVKARVQAVSGPSLLGLNVHPNGTIVALSTGYEWRRVELIYQKPKSSITTVASGANAFEMELKQLSGWIKLCSSRVPIAERPYCEPGDSLPAVMNAELKPKTSLPPAAVAAGVEKEYIFNGKGGGMAKMLSYLQNFHSSALQRWFNQDVTVVPIESIDAMRSMFAFYIPSSYLTEWDTFINSELEPLLKDTVKSGIGSASLFYRVDGLSTDQFSWAVTNALLWATLAAVGSLISTIIITRRFLLGAAAVLLAGIASAAAGAAVSKFHEDGFVEFPAVAIACWFVNAANSADLAIACVRVWESEDPFPYTVVGEVSRVVADKLDLWAMPDPKKKALMCLWRLVQCLIWITRKSFPPREIRDETPLTEWFPLGRMYWFVVHLMMPSVVPIVALFIISGQTELLLLQEFAMHAGPGLLASTVFAAILFPPVIDMGDVLHMKTERWSCDRCCTRFKCCICRCINRIAIRIGRLTKKLNGHCIAMECGGNPAWRERLRDPLEIFAEVLTAPPMRLVALGLMITVAIGFSLSKWTSKFVPTAPPLFPIGHRSREGPKVQTFFGQLPRRLEAPQTLPLVKARFCQAGAWDNASCAWYFCESEQGNKISPGMCKCKTKSTNALPTTTPAPFTTSPSLVGGIPSSLQSTGSCSAVARIVGLPSPSYLSQPDFWNWAENAIGVVLGDGNNQYLTPQMLGEIELESWATGAFTWHKQFSIGLKTATGDSPRFENACVPLICYCHGAGVAPCNTKQPTAFGRTLGQVSHLPLSNSSSSSGGRRLPADSGDASTSEALQEILDESMLPRAAPPFQEPRSFRNLQGASTVATASTISVIWGLQKSDQIPFKTSTISLKFINSFDMADPWTQRNIYSLCVGTPRELKILNRHCWVIDFRRWLLGQNQDYPVNAAYFYGLFFQFAVYRHTFHSAASSVNGASANGGVGFDFFWLADDGAVRGTFATFEVDAPDLNDRKLLKDFMQQWTSYLDARNGKAKAKTGQSWMASAMFSESQTVDAVRESSYQIVSVILALSCSMTFLLTCSLGITLAVFITLILSLFTFITFWSGLGNRNVSSLEVVGLAVFFSGLATPLIRMGDAYSHARDRPHVPEKYMIQWQQSEVPAARSIEDDAEDIAEGKDEGSEGNCPENLLFPGAIDSERQQRVATAMQFSGGAALGLGCAAMTSGLALLPLEMEALGQIGLAILCLGFTVTPAACGLLPMLLLVGLGDSKARIRAFKEIGSFLFDKCRGKVPDRLGFLDGRSKTGGLLMFQGPRDFPERAPNSSELGVPRASDGSVPPKPHAIAAMMLGVPAGIANGNPEFWKPKLPFACRRKPKKKKETAGAESMDDVGAESGPFIRTLDLQCATAMPPHHIVVATRDVINAKG